MQQLARYGDNDIDEERAVEKFLRVVPKKYSQVAITIEMLLDFSELSIEEVTGRLKAVDNREQLPPSEPVTIGGKLLFTEEQWLARQRERNEGEASGSSASGSSSSRKRRPPSGTRRVVALLAAPTASARLPSTTPATIAGGPATGPRTAGRRSAAVRHTSRKRRRVTSRLCSPAPAAAALLHLDEPWAHVFLGNGFGGDKIDGWYLDAGATHHMTGRREFFSEVDSGVRGSVKFGDASAVDIKGVGSVVFTAKTGEHRLLTGVYYIPALRNSIRLGQLDENGSHVEIEHGVLRI